MKKKNIGSSFDDWLREEGFYEEAASVASKRVLARQISKETIQQSARSEPPNRDSTSRHKTRLA
jgi:hypothetical protein